MPSPSKFAYPLAIFSAVLLVLPFPMAGPTPAWRMDIALVALVPLVLALLIRSPATGVRLILRNVLLGYLCGIVWYGGTCTWVYPTMYLYGNMPKPLAALLLVLFCLYLGLYYAFFALLVTLTHRATGKTGWTLFFTPFLWVAMELACARVTSFPWDQLGISQIDNLFVSRLAMWTGVYGISFLIVTVNCLFAAALLLRGRGAREMWRNRGIAFAVAVLLVVGVRAAKHWRPAPSPSPATAMLLQPNLNVNGNNDWSGTLFDVNVQRLAALSENKCLPYIDGMPETAAQLVRPECAGAVRPTPATPLADVILWPESPAPFQAEDQHFQHWVSALVQEAHAPMIAGDIAILRNANPPNSTEIFNSASFIAPDGAFVGHYDKMHLVPFGEYVPFQQWLSFAGGLTAQVGTMTHGTRRTVFTINGHIYGTFICYESIFADEVRQFPLLGADVLVNLSDDGWYGDTSAPWQHLNMARMRAVENHRWVLRDTNSGVTASIDPYGRVVEALPRHTQSSLQAHFGYISDVTFYAVHGDLFAWLCAIIAIVLAVDGCLQHPPLESDSRSF